MASTPRFLREYLRPNPAAVEVVETTYVRDRVPVPASLYRPAGARRRLPGWILLHGLTGPGRHHASLTRFARALAAGGAIVFIPEIPEWTRLRVAPALTGPTVHAALDALAELGVTEPGRTAVLGFSFGATQILAAVGDDPALAERVRAIAAWGGYHDLHRLFHFGVTGEHTLDGERFLLPPDPYGRWIMGANYLTRIPGREDDDAVARALEQLAIASGRRGMPAWAPVYDPLKAELRAGLTPDQQVVFDVFAPPAGEAPSDREFTLSISRALADAALRTDPILDPGRALARLRTPTLLAHGRGDRLIPFTETVQLDRAIPGGCRIACSITGLFAHSGAAAGPRGALRSAREVARFLGLLHRLLNLA